MEFLANYLWYIIITILGIVILVMPYEKWESLFPKAPSKAVTKACGAIAAVIGIALIVMTAIGFV
ncbi:MAG: hypothetical protein J1F42_10530 [Lachnospiraceae bacterium]|nr:hypothetical protein [Lachnospiraceae bacterium]